MSEDSSAKALELFDLLLRGTQFTYRLQSLVQELAVEANAGRTIPVAM